MSTMGHREETVAALKKAGFKVPGDLPEEREAGASEVRSATEIARRLMALEAVFSWAGAPEDAMSSERLRDYAKRNRLEEEMTEDELDVWHLERQEAQEEHGETIGWLLENLWPLAWALGYPRAPELDAEMVTEETVGELFYEFLPGLDGTIDALLAKAKPRSADELCAAEDLFACALHIAEAGARNVPPGFDPVDGADILGERWSSLRWCALSERDWDEPDADE